MSRARPPSNSTPSKDFTHYDAERKRYAVDAGTYAEKCRSAPRGATSALFAGNVNF